MSDEPKFLDVDDETPQPLSLGGLRDALRECSPEAPLMFVGTDLPAWWAGLVSWRGIYAEPSVKYSGTAATVADALRDIDEAIEGQRVFRGWKGGEFQYGEHDPLHVDNEGDYTGDRRIVSVLPREGAVLLVTRKVERYL
ncbi:MAG: hypothetical protein IPK80_02845 [Nannocystis sp.]|nr:hypothetical protein [Nannocystis sp.]